MQKPELSYPYDDLPPAGTTREVAPGVHWLQMPLPFALDHINLYLIEDGEGWCVVDTGLKNEETQGYWEQIFETALGGKPVTRVIVTHLHPDHSGNAGWLCSRWNAALLMARAEYYQARALIGEGPQDFPPEAVEFYRKGGIDGDLLAEISERGWGNFSNNVERFPVGYYRLLDEQELEIGGHTWRVITGSGHSPEHACLYCKELDVLISGDQVLPRITSNVSVNPNEPEENPLEFWIDSHAKFLKELPDSPLVLPSHDRPFYGLHDRLSYLIHHHEDRMLALEEACIEPKTSAQLLPVLFKRELDSFQTMLALGECIAHLHCLIRRGRIVREITPDEIYVYRSIDPSLAQRARPDQHDEREDAPMMV
ncbi:MAG: MBL fold metallo-hydrolase [Alphaproteobacteria bacterium]|nr:MBL fold metallo-hydrolase [Alphaproteobacteria bacterium]